MYKRQNPNHTDHAYHEAVNRLKVSLEKVIINWKNNYFEYFNFFKSMLVDSYSDTKKNTRGYESDDTESISVFNHLNLEKIIMNLVSLN